MLNFELVGTEHCLGFLLFINGYKARNKQTSKTTTTKIKHLQADRRPQFHKSSPSMQRADPPTLCILYCGVQILEEERKQKTATTHQVETKPDVEFSGFSRGYGPLCIICASCVTASVEISQSGKLHRQPPKSRGFLGVNLRFLSCVSSSTC